MGERRERGASMADEDPYGGDDGGGGGGGNFDFSDVEFSGEQLRGILNSVQTQAEHWLSQDAVFALNEAIKAFVSHISEGSLKILESEKKNVLTPVHVVASLERSGFDAIAKELKEKHGKLLDVSRKKKKEPEISEEQMIALQQKLFAQAKAKANSAANL